MTDTLREFVENNPKLVTRRESTRYPGLFVIKYTRKVFYDNLWSPELEECRGLVVDKDWNRVVTPFRKIYNRGERGKDFALTDHVTAVRKINGFMAAATLWNGQVIISTTGSLDSPFVTLAEKWLDGPVKDWIAARNVCVTWLFEICDPLDPHIIEESAGAYLIGCRMPTGHLMAETTLDHFAASMGHVLRPHFYSNISFSTVLNLARACKHEGFVVRKGDEVIKVKSPYYLVTKFLGRMAYDKLLERIHDESIYQTIDEEFYPLVDYLRSHSAELETMDDAARINYIRNFLEKR
jgi:hypothetical protein